METDVVYNPFFQHIDQAHRMEANRLQHQNTGGLQTKTDPHIHK